ncbi:MAG: catalase-related domain-containing protein, partial [Acidimicrobiales bacterium]
GRLFSYPDAHRYRIGPNYLQLPVNAPKAAVHSYNKDGAMAYRNPADPVYAPNSVGGPQADPAHAEPSFGEVTGEIVRAAYSKRRDDDDFGQPGTLYRKVLDEDAKSRLVENITAHLQKGVQSDVLARALEYWRNIDGDLGARLAKEVGNGA